MKRVSVSVLMAVFNAEKSLERAIESIRHQTLSDWELIIVDDGSTDRCREILDQAVAAESRIRVLRHEGGGNRGLTASLNLAFSQAQGEWIARQDADDWSDPRRLEFCLKAAALNQGLCSFWTTGWRTVREGVEASRIPKVVKAFSHLSPLLPRRVLEFGNLLVHGTFFVRSDLMRELGGYREKFFLAQDYDFLLRAMEHTPIGFVPEPLYELTFSSRSLSAEKEARQFQFALLAGLMSIERRAGHGDRYDSLNPKEPEALVKLLSQDHPWYVKGVKAFYQVRKSV